jgi:hypothetical protein
VKETNFDFLPALDSPLAENPGSPIVIPITLTVRMCLYVIHLNKGSLLEKKMFG